MNGYYAMCRTIDIQVWKETVKMITNTPLNGIKHDVPSYFFSIIYKDWEIILFRKAEFLGKLRYGIDPWPHDPWPLPLTPWPLTPWPLTPRPAAEEGRQGEESQWSGKKRRRWRTSSHAAHTVSFQKANQAVFPQVFTKVRLRLADTSKEWSNILSKDVLTLLYRIILQYQTHTSDAGSGANRDQRMQRAVSHPTATPLDHTS